MLSRYRMFKVIQHFDIFLEDTKSSTKISHWCAEFLERNINLYNSSEMLLRHQYKK